MSNHAYGTYPPRKRRNVWPWIIGGALVAMLIVCSVAISTTGTNSDGEGAGTWSAPPATATDLAPAEPEPEPEATTTAPAPKVAPTKTSKAPAPKPTIDEGIWHVGEDVPAGTYRTEQRLTADQMCYWERSKTSDTAELGDIIANANPSGGRPQVTLRKGEWFTSNRCGTWVKR